MMTIFKSLSPALLAAFLLAAFAAPALSQGPVPSPDYSMTLIKVLDPRSPEAPNLTVRTYTVARGDSVIGLMRRQGLIHSRSDEAKLLALVKDLNPELKDLNLLEPGQKLNLPAALEDGAPALNEGQPKAPELEPVTGVPYRRVLVRRGDNLVRLLRRQGLSDEMIHKRFLRLTLDINPELRDPNLIEAGSELKIPVLSELAAVQSQPAPAAEAGPNIQAPPLWRARPEAASASARASLSLALTRLGFKVDREGLFFLSWGGRTFQVDQALFPMVELGQGRQLILDAGSDLPRSAVEALAAQQPPVKVFRRSKRESLERALRRLWLEAGFYRVYGRGQLYEGGDDIRLTLRARQIVWPTAAAWNAGRPLIIERRGPTGLGCDGRWAAFLREHGLELLELSGNRLLPPRPPELLPGPKIERLEPGGEQRTLWLAARLLRLWGAEISWSEAEEAAGEQRMLLAQASGGRTWALALKTLPQAQRQAAAEAGWRLLELDDEDGSAVRAAARVLNLKLRQGLKLRAPVGGPELSLTIKGLLVAAPGGDYFISEVELPETLRLLLPEDLTLLTLS